MEIKIRRPDDFHVHLRSGKILEAVFLHTANVFSRALVMPNTNPPILTAKDAKQYQQEILRLVFTPNDFAPLMTIKLTAFTTPTMICEVKEGGVIAGKAYPVGVTTNSGEGISNFSELYPVFREMEHLGMILSIHGEKPGVDCLNAEVEFLPILESIATDFPGLKIVMEHITTKKAVETIITLPENVAATITTHHLELTFDDVISDKLRPHNFCKPVAKRRKDREALIIAALSGNPKFFFGSDSAPHLRLRKENSEAPPGIFSAPVVLPLLMQIFEERNALDKLEGFVSRFGAEFYGLKLNKETIKLIKETWNVPTDIGGIVPFMAGKTLQWQVI